MFEFGRDLRRVLQFKKGLGIGAARGRCDPAFLELLDLQLLAAHGKASDVAAGRVSTRDPYPHHLDSAAIWREHARRSGDAAALLKSANAAASAEAGARTSRERARAQLERALTGLVGADLFGDPALTAAAVRHLKAAAEIDGDPAHEARLKAAWARIASREALAGGDYDRALEAAALFDQAIHALDEEAKETRAPGMRLEAAAARLERADLLIGFGQRQREGRLIEGALKDLIQLLARLDADYEPLTASRVAELTGSALMVLGEIAGRADQIAEGVSTLAEIGARVDSAHSPLDWAQSQHALALALQALGEACDSDDAFVQADAAFDRSWRVVRGATVAIRATIANNRAACLARRAERMGDLAALTRAEAAFKAELATSRPEVDPVAWAVVQVNLARVYEARAELETGFAARQAALYAYEAAFEVFSEHGLKTLSESAAAGLERVRETAGLTNTDRL
jgi:tetratricopeptide (TPR) repeat protein